MQNLNPRATPSKIVRSLERFLRLLLLAIPLSSLTHVGAAELVAVKSRLYPTRGNPTSAVATHDGRYVFVSVTNVGQPNFAGPDSVAGGREDAASEIEVFRSSRSGDALRSVAFVRTGSTGANGLVLLPGERTLAVGVGDEGVAFLDVHELVRGEATPRFARQTKGAGTFDVVATPDGAFVFSSNEYGMIDGQRGSVGITATHIDKRGQVTNPETLGQIPLGDVVPSLTISPDGTRLYVATELLPKQEGGRIAGSTNSVLSKSDCVQRLGTPARPNGYVSVIDVNRAVTLKQDAIIARIASGCSPVRLVESADSRLLFVSARGDDAILTFDTHALEHDPDHAFLRSLASGGRAPVGIRLLENDRLLAIANSNRFAESDGTIAIVDVSVQEQAAARIEPAGGFPRNISLGPDGSTLYLTNYKSRSLQTIRIAK